MDPFGPDDDVFDDVDLAAIVAEEADAARRNAAIEAGRRWAGPTGAAMAGIMLVLSDIYEPRQREEIAVVAEAAGEPGDIDTEGIDLSIDGLGLWSPPADGLGGGPAGH